MSYFLYIFSGGKVKGECRILREQNLVTRWCTWSSEDLRMPLATCSMGAIPVPPAIMFIVLALISFSFP